MISIVVSSYKPDLFLQFEKSVAQTIGVEYEIIKVENAGLMGLCAAYNIGISKAKYDYICFSHEDIIFRTEGWGIRLIEVFSSDSKIGLLGIAGSSYKSYLPSGWAPPQHTRFPKANLLQYRNQLLHHLYDNYKNEELSDVVTLDGCWFVAKREVVDKYKFDEDTFKGYHCYDIDFCLGVGLHYNLKVVYNILIEHLSLGSYDKNWMIETVKLHAKWKDLPRRSENMTNKDILNQEFLSLKEWLKLMKKNKYGNNSYILSLLFSNDFKKLLGLKYWLYFPIYVIKQLKKSFGR